MFRVPDGAARRLRGWISHFVAALALLAFAGAADARAAKQAPDSSRYAAIVVDANTDTVLREAHADSLRHPASLTKVMTLYLLFERLESGRLKLSTPLPVSAEAAAQAPTKLGLKPGQTIIVEDAIKALITKSANDVAVVVAEAIAGSEEEFARLMTRKARALGMTRTVYRNASGLPDDEQVTTARDQARLGIHIQERFPRYYRYFSLTRFTYRGATMRNHNRLLGQVAGADGIKTGYTHASGFNLIASVRRNGRHIVAVVLGGNSAAQRDAHMRGLIERHIVEASVRRPDVKIARAPAAAELPAKSQAAARPELRAEAQSAPQPRSEPQAEPRAIPRIVIVPVVAPPTDAANMASPGSSEPAAAEIAAEAAPIAPVRAAILPLPVPQLNAFAPAPEAAPPAIEVTPLPSPAETQPNPPEQAVTGNIGETAEPVLRMTRAGRDGGWAIQVGAFEREDDARQRLLIARKKAAELLSGADPHTEKTTKGAKTYYRARFTGFDRAGAEAACKALQRADVVCLALKI